MSEPIKDGGPAFPTQTPYEYIHGMSLRDWIAGQALNGVLLAPGQVGQQAINNPEHAAAWAYQYADAMLIAREAKP